jgi:hypothetical protein
MTIPGTFDVAVPRLKVQHIIDWIEPQLASGALLSPGRLPPNLPHRAIGIIPQPGRGFDTEGAFDNPAYNFQCRGGADNFSDAEDIAYEVDSVILASPTNFDIAEGVHIESIYRMSGAPTSSPITDAQSRWTFQCQYIFHVGTNLYLPFD